ncbi:FeoB-associated Cys-rich membrane protein [Sunxiuqinia sp. A32]|uniref:FeoB-associated Cys-rich membrane protein n=1 Tax=Sunxiuqinia sp. A32 TaxID=3461496 RepID=UPI004045D49F
MIQEILTYIIVLGAFTAAGYKIYQALPINKKKATDGKCGSCTTGCALKDLNGAPECPTEDQVKFYL